MNTETITCVVCDTTHERGTEGIGQWTDVIGGKECEPYLVCAECHESGKHDGWREKAIAELRGSNVAFISRGSLALDIAELRSYLKHDERIKDGVCPNGCALMVADPDDDRDQKCPSCGFTQHNRVLSGI